MDQVKRPSEAPRTYYIANSATESIALPSVAEEEGDDDEDDDILNSISMTEDEANFSLADVQPNWAQIWAAEMFVPGLSPVILTEEEATFVLADVQPDMEKLAAVDRPLPIRLLATPRRPHLAPPGGACDLIRGG
ncbi:hypothetical protein IWQ60_007961 [Tieghemiomyces parasiticus]|uniref:Uncharacterized protein n=1 Tax=Tieghemiomyces parasiticus TaxID=78921 RepID=A0A9W8DP51_9FUNG|nr:hypothetical protein IWQ60_007961 [Tieghemiomyces parasiticus]